MITNWKTPGNRSETWTYKNRRNPDIAIERPQPTYFRDRLAEFVRLGGGIRTWPLGLRFWNVIKCDLMHRGTFLRFCIFQQDIVKPSQMIKCTYTPGHPHDHLCSRYRLTMSKNAELWRWFAMYMDRMRSRTARGVLRVEVEGDCEGRMVLYWLNMDRA